ncbi:hypothetical protein J1N35_029272 [Gossypium stocksii]|uniref:Ripening-related protein 1 n=1 Tax=Gossypium stocksii TaxID=47602 RepID=A0A9D3ZTE2_9ROSI|nr:hypothetical protein J1N35_029272 [Gossypium stocksii]
MKKHNAAIFKSLQFRHQPIKCSVDNVEAETCNPSGKIKGKTPPLGQCNQENDSDCCKDGKCQTKATLMLNSFERDGDSGAPSECDNQYHSNDDPMVAFSIGCNGKYVRAKVVDECDSTMGCDSDHDYQTPYPNNIVDASKAIWKALGVPENDWGEMDIYWSDTD